MAGDQMVMEPLQDDGMELSQVFFSSVIQVPGYSGDMLRAGGNMSLKLMEDLLRVERAGEWVRYIPKHHILVFETEEDGRKSKKASEKGSGKRSGVDAGAASAGGRGRKKKAS